jgi:PPOX class probable F420-dependent enzyme
MPDMTRAEAVEFLAAGTRPGKLAVASSSPHVAPIWFVVDGDDLVFTTGERTVKGRSLLADPRAALCVDTDVFPYSFVIVRGPVALERAAPDLVEWSTRIAARYVPAEKAQWYGERNGVPGEMLCRLRMQRVIAERDIAL